MKSAISWMLIGQHFGAGSNKGSKAGSTELDYIVVFPQCHILLYCTEMDW